MSDKTRSRFSLIDDINATRAAELEPLQDDTLGSY